jgi:N-acetylneuraminic acid mutarotase
MWSREKPMLVIIGSALLASLGCGGKASMGVTPTAGGGASTGAPTAASPTNTHNQWTWVGGSSIANQSGVYGTQGIASASNVPGARYEAVSWTDSSGNFWLFGGVAAITSVGDDLLNDLWKYSAGQWTWMGGSSGFNQAGRYGTEGMGAPGNVPGARAGAVGWTDEAGNFWLFGGNGFDANGGSALLNDLWKYSSGEWTWVSGAKAGIFQTGIYGSKGATSPGSVPGSRIFAVSWTDAAGNLWLFGGLGVDSVGSNGYLNDMWEYSGGEWTWVTGSNLISQPGNYGTEGVASPTNIPGARGDAVGWTDISGSLWLFGGDTGPTGSTSRSTPMNDLWKFSSGQWTWMDGSSQPYQFGVYGTEGTAASGNVPGARDSPAVWIDSAGNSWLFSGGGFDSVGNTGVDDLWKYSAGEWTWEGGPKLGTTSGTYGTQGTSSPDTIPGPRLYSVTWRDASGELWVFGGVGPDSTRTVGQLNDLWKYEP